MGLTVTWSGMALAAWAVFAYKLRDLRQDRANPALRSLCLTFAFLAVTLTFAVPDLVRPLERATGLYYFWSDVPMTAGLGALQTTVLLLRYPMERARSRIRRRLVVSAVAAASIAVLHLVAAVSPAERALAESALSREEFLLAQPGLSEARLAFHLFVLYTLCDLVWLNLRHRRVVDRRWLRRGLDAVTVSAMITVARSLIIFTQIMAARHFDTVLLPVMLTLDPLIVAVIVTGTLWGFTVPAWGPRLDRVRSFRRLGPLWSALCRATPEVVLDTPGLRHARWWRGSELDFRLYRRLIEIRDSRLALRPYLDEDIADDARRRGQRAGLAGDELTATVEAATLAAAIHAKAGGRPATTGNQADTTQDDQDLAEELAWFTRVARAFTDSPVVAEVTERLPRRAPRGSVADATPLFAADGLDTGAPGDCDPLTSLDAVTRDGP